MGFRPGQERSLDLSTGISPFWIGRTAAPAPLLATDAVSGCFPGREWDTLDTILDGIQMGGRC